MRQLHPKLFLVFAVLFSLFAFLWSLRSLHSENFIFYLPKARHVVPLTVVENVRYLPLVQVLNLVGTVGGLQEKRTSLKVWVGDKELELHAKDNKIRVNKVAVKLSAPSRLVNGEWMVAVDFLTSVLPALTPEHIEYQVGTDRAFIGNVNPISFSARLDPIANGARLTLQFTDKVKVQTAAVNGRWVVYLGDQPVVAREASARFQNPYVSSLQFDDQDGVPKLIITPSSGGLNFYPTLGQEEKVLTADIWQPAPVTAQQPAGSEQPGKAPGTGAGPSQAGSVNPPGAPGAPASPGPNTAPAAPPLPALVLDAGHGGADAGAGSRDGVVEKNLAAQLVERVHVSLLATKKYRVVLTRAGDADPSLDERDVAANTARHPKPARCRVSLFPGAGFSRSI